MNPAHSVSSTAAINLRRLMALRVIALIGQAVAIWVAIAQFHLALPMPPLVTILAAIFVVNVLTWLRLKQSWPVHDGELFAHLTLDVLALGGLLYFTGGSTNPFVSLFLLPLTLAAAALPWAYTWAITALTVACYSALLFFFVPLPQIHAGHGDGFHLHVLGMWLGFLLSAALISYFCVKVRDTLRERDQLRTQVREQELRHERVLALGTLAAGAAHELGTPLSTIAVLARELERDAVDVPEKVAILRAQVGRCKEILSSLSGAAGQTRAEGGGKQALDTYLASLIERWCAMRAEVKPLVHWHGPKPAPDIVTEQTLSQAIVNTLNNAADVSPRDVMIDGYWSANELSIEVRDRGPGFSAQAMEHAGEPFFSTKGPGEGMGLGLFLARGTIERLGGRVVFGNREGGGAVCRIELPLASLRVKA
jgi:two-component system, sensor histidine kinase RegB